MIEYKQVLIDFIDAPVIELHQAVSKKVLDDCIKTLPAMAQAKLAIIVSAMDMAAHCRKCASHDGLSAHIYSLYWKKMYEAEKARNITDSFLINAHEAAKK